MKKLHQLRSFFLLMALVLCLACGAGSSSSGDSTTAGLGGPNPEDVFDLPNTLPNSFQLSSCPDFSGQGITTVRDLAVVMHADGAAFHDYDGDGDDDSILLYAQSLTPRTVTFEVYRLMNQPIPPQLVDTNFSTFFLAGWEADEDNQSAADPQGNFMQSFGGTIYLANWVPNYVHPIVRQTYIPGQAPGDPNFPPFPPEGFEGCLFQDPQCSFGTNMAGGVHMFAASFVDTLGVQHCTLQSYRMLICPVAGHC